MLWFLERESDLLICEVRQAIDGPEFELAVRRPGEPEEVVRFDQPTRLIEEWLTRQRRFRELGWRPRP